LRDADFRRILLIKPSALGDVIHALPVLDRLRARFPEATIDWFITPENAELVRHHPALSNVVMFDRKVLANFGRSVSATLGMFRLLWSLRRRRYDLVIDLHGQLRSALFCFATRSKTRIGFNRTREGAWLVYTHRVDMPTMEAHAVDRYLWISELLGLEPAAPSFTIRVPPQATARVDALLKAAGADARPLAVIVPGTVWETKHWSAEGFAGVARELLARGMQLVLAGAPQDRPRCRAVAAAAPGVYDLCGKTNLPELASLIDRSAVCVTNDSGSMHLAVAMDRPVVSVFGPTNPVRTGPYGRPEAVVQAGVECAPCYFKKLTQCPHDHRCMHEVTPALVLARIDSLLATARAA
jgi:lipopolysaccharide heptosyltransferase I